MGHLKYNKDTPRKAEAWITTHGLIDYGGATLGQYCAFMGISDQTHYDWERDHLDYLEAIKRAKEAFKGTLKNDAIIGLRELCNGYTAEEVVDEYERDENGKPEKVRSVVKKKYIPRNTAAVIFALTNLDPEHWQNKQNNETKLNAEGIQVVFNQSAGTEARTTEDE